jgi:hypothetical protein
VSAEESSSFRADPLIKDRMRQLTYARVWDTPLIVAGVVAEWPDGEHVRLSRPLKGVADCMR